MSGIVPATDPIVLPRDSATAIVLAGAAPASVVATRNNETAVAIERRPASSVVVHVAIPGPRGQPGEQGEPGRGLAIKGALASIADLPPAAAEGDGYLIAGELWAFGPAGWVNGGAVQGPAGKDGRIRFTGAGLPPTVIVGASPGDTYLDVLTGNVYKPE